MPRLDVRMDAEQRRRLEELGQERGAPISEVVRALIDDAYEGIMQERRRRAAARNDRPGRRGPAGCRHALA